MDMDKPGAKLEIKMKVESEEQLIAILESLVQLVKTLKDLEAKAE